MNNANLTKTEFENIDQEMQNLLVAQLETVYDPEFPVIDIRTLGLIYKLTQSETKDTLNVVMTFTTPACPMGEMIEEMVKNVILDVYPSHEVSISITFDPLRSPQMIKDKDLQRMFE